MTKGNDKVLFGGVTTQFEVKALMERLDTKPGDIIEHDQIAKVIGAPWKSNRYAAVVSAWRKLLFKERNILLRSISGVGYEVLDDRGKMRSAASKLVSGTRAIGKAAVHLGSVQAENLPEPDRKTFDHQSRITNELVLAGNKARKTIAARIGEYESNPRPRLRAVNEGRE